MLIGEPGQTQADLNFKLLGFPIRVHPLFWVVSALMGYSTSSLPIHVILWVAAVFVSIVIHELGHALVMRYFGEHPWIVLYSFGGLAISQRGVRGAKRQMIISLAGPVMGFLFAGLIVLVLRIAGNEIEFLPSIPFVFISPFGSINAYMFTYFLLYLNIVWGLVNLLPVYPLDGGQFARAALVHVNPHNGFQVSLSLSLAAAVGMAIYSVLHGQTYVAIMFGILAYESLQMIQSLTGRRGW